MQQEDLVPVSIPVPRNGWGWDREAAMAVLLEARPVPGTGLGWAIPRGPSRPASRRELIVLSKISRSGQRGSVWWHPAINKKDEAAKHPATGLGTRWALWKMGSATAASGLDTAPAWLQEFEVLKSTWPAGGCLAER